MSRLINADKLIEELKNLAKGEVPSCPNIAEYFVSIRVDRIIDRLNTQPTAYDVDKVVEQLHKGAYYIDIETDRRVVNLNEAIEIVKDGGIDEKSL